MKGKITASIALKLCVIICSLWGVWLNVCTPEKIFGNPSAMLYFTIQSNLWICITCLVGLVIMLRRSTVSHTMAVLKLVFTVAITLTGMVYCFVLAPTGGPETWALKSNLVHVVVPIAAVADFFVSSSIWGTMNQTARARAKSSDSESGRFSLRKPRYLLTGRDTWWVILPPLYYLGFASIGYVQNWHFSSSTNYPYFFMNWGSPAGAFGFCKGLPFMGVMWYVFALLIFLILVGRLYVALGKKVA